MKSGSWPRRIFDWAWLIFNAEPVASVEWPIYIAIILGGLIYLACAVVVLVVLNIFTIPFGFYAEPLWRPNATFRKLYYPGGIPVIAVNTTLGVLLTTARSMQRHGMVFALFPFVVTAGAGVAIFVLFVMAGRLRRRLKSRELEL